MMESMTGKVTPRPSSDPGPSPPWRVPTAVYVHIPFCRHHCHYCDFAIATGKNHLKDRYLDAVEAEFTRLGESRPVETWFWGGGTPSELSPEQILRLCQIMRRWVPLNPGGEFSLEVNPDDCDPARLAAMAEGGVTRVSIGVQSFHNATLEFLERRHDPTQVASAVALARQSGIANISLDLIFGSPGQSLELWKRDLQSALEFQPNHFSTYGLTYEKGTPLWKRMTKGDFLPLADDQELSRYELAIDLLEQAGFEHYEVSNFAKPGRRCKHNEVYWANHAYFGAGMGAARYVNGKREVNTRDLDAYLRKSLAGEETAFQSESLSPLEEAKETLGLNLRRQAGARRAEFLQRTGLHLEEIVGSKAEPLVEKGLLIQDMQGVRLTRQGRYLFDWVIGRLF